MNTDKWDKLTEKINVNETFKSYVNVNGNLHICGEHTEDDINSDMSDRTVITKKKSKTHK